MRSATRSAVPSGARSSDASGHKRESTVAPRTGRAVRERLRFETFLSDLSSDFINVPIERVDAQIQDGLKRFVQFLKVDRVILASAVAPDRTATILGSYAVPGVTAMQPMQPFHGLASMRWYTGELVEGRVVRLRSLDDLPASARAERDYFRSAGIKSHLGIPIRVNGLPLCMLGIATFHHERSFSHAMLPRLRIVGEVFANALVRRNADRDLRRIHNELAHVTRVSTVGHLAASIAHEINQPLCAIVSNATAAIRLLARPTPDIEDVRAALSDIVADGQRAGTVVAKAHALLKRQEVELTEVAPNDVINDVAMILHSDALVRRIGLHTELAGDVPAVRADRVQLQQVVMNLVLNAMDSIAQAPDGPRQITLRTRRADGADAGAQITVSDTGVGLSPEVVERMFQPFFTTKRHGLGMGLAINQDIIRAHHGRMWAANAPPRGATVGFALPPAARHSPSASA